MIAYYQASPRWHCYQKPSATRHVRGAAERPARRKTIGLGNVKSRTLSCYGFEYRPAAVA